MKASMANPLRYIGFSGGGWNTHTVSSGMMSAALQMARERGATDGDFGLLLNNFNGAAGNSGGSWFLTMLSYSPGFADALANQPDDWFTSGYMGQQRQIFQPNSLPVVPKQIKTAVKDFLNQTTTSSKLFQAISGIPLIGAYAERISTWINNSLVELTLGAPNIYNSIDLYSHLFEYLVKYEVDWLEMVRNTTYKPYDMSRLLSQGFNEIDRNPWATNLQLILPGAFDTSNVASFKDNSNYYTTSAQARNPAFPVDQFISPVSIVIGPSENQTNTFKLLGSEFIQEFQKNSIISLFNESTRASLGQFFKSELSIIEAATLSGSFAGDLSSIRTYQNLISSEIDTLKSKLIASTDSGLSWIPNILGTRDLLIKGVNAIINDSFDSLIKPIVTNTISPGLGLFTSKLAVPVSLSNETARYQKPESSFNSLAELAAAQNYRFIDGGYVDNTTVANIVSEIQSDNGIEQGFDLTFFVNNTDKGIIPKEFTDLESDLDVPLDLAGLFGGGSDQESWQTDQQIRDFAPFDTPAAFPYIFNRSAWKGEKPVWQWDNRDEWEEDEEKATYLAYYKLDVETIDNPYFSIKEKQGGELNIFTSYNLSSGPGPYDPSFFNLYENIYQATREGIINQGGYVHLLSAMNVMNLATNEQGQLSFVSDEGLNHLIQIDLDQVDTDYLSLFDIYKLTEDGQRIYSGSLGGSDEEAPFEYDNGPQALLMNEGDSLEFEMQSKSSSDPIKGSIQLQEVDNGYQLLGLSNGKSLFSATASFAPVIDGKESVDDDETARDSSDDTYFSFIEGTRLKIAVNAIAAMTNRFSIIKIDRDPITGEASYLGSAIDSSEMNNLLINTFGQKQSGTTFGSKTLNPYSQREFTWTVGETGLFAPVLLTEEGGIFALGHDLIGESTHTRILGDYTVGFEDQYDRNSDYDYNDAIIKFETIA